MGELASTRSFYAVQAMVRVLKMAAASLSALYLGLLLFLVAYGALMPRGDDRQALDLAGMTDPVLLVGLKGAEEKTPQVMRF